MSNHLASVPRAAERLILVETGLKLYDVFNSAVFPGKTAAEKQEYAQLLGAVWLGHLRMRPLNASKVAHAVGMPRTTALRRLEELMAAGHVRRVGTRFYLADKIANSTASADRLSKIILDAADAIKKARNEPKWTPNKLTVPEQQLINM
jgi:hypothetical protein